MKETIIKVFEVLGKKFEVMGIQVSILSFYIYAFVILIILKFVKGGNNK